MNVNRSVDRGCIHQLLLLLPTDQCYWLFIFHLKLEHITRRACNELQRVVWVSNLNAKCDSWNGEEERILEGWGKEGEGGSEEEPGMRWKKGNDLGLKLSKKTMAIREWHRNSCFGLFFLGGELEISSHGFLQPVWDEPGPAWMEKIEGQGEREGRRRRREKEARKKSLLHLSQLVQETWLNTNNIPTRDEVYSRAEIISPLFIPTLSSPSISRAATLKWSSSLFRIWCEWTDDWVTKCLISRMKRVTFTTCLFLSFSLSISTSSTCPKIIEGRSPSNGSCLEACQNNKDCPGPEKCCPTSCGGHICTSGGLDVRKNECEVIVCGANAECVLDSADSPSLCKCKPGFSGDPNDPLTGCTKSSKLKLMCDYNNKSYGIEESFFDGCKLKCVCTEALEVDCTPRCPLPSDHETATSDPLCSLIEDPKDSCCKIVACESRSVFQTTPLIDPVLNVSSSSSSVSSAVIDVGNGTANTIGVNEPLPSDGCRSQSGQFYKKGDTFFEECDSKCSCHDSGEIQCEPRCSLFQGKWLRFLFPYSSSIFSFPHCFPFPPAFWKWNKKMVWKMWSHLYFRSTACN